MGDYDALRPAERQRLERFAAAFEDVDPLEYEAFAGTTASDEDVAAAREAALTAIGGGSRRKAAQLAMRSFTDAAERALAREATPPQIIFGGRTGSVRTEDRIRLLQSLERAVAAVIAWDELREADRDVLLGPWAFLAARAESGAR